MKRACCCLAILLAISVCLLYLLVGWFLSLLAFQGWVASPTPSPTAVSVPWPTVAPAPGTSFLEPGQTLARIQMAPRPQRDLYALSSRLKGLTIAPPTPGIPLARQIGQVETFWISDQEHNTHFQITATLRYITPHSYFYVDNAVSYEADSLKQAAETFENKILPTNLRLFGDFWRPGPDGDIRLTILNTRTPGAGGYYSSADEYPSTVNPYSNQRRMIYIDVKAYPIGTERYLGVLAHELQHAIHWQADPDEDGWVNEGLSELAMRLNGFPVGGPERAFARQPDTQLNTWSDQPAANTEHYGASYLFLSYFHQRFGEEALRDLVREPANGIAGFEAVLAKRAPGLRFADLFRDWVIANYLDDPNLAGGIYGYRDVDVRASLAATHTKLPVAQTAQVHQFAADYIELRPPQANATLYFTGTTFVPLLPVLPHSGQGQWWSNRGDDMNSTLTREVDLRGLTRATLRFSLWYDIEKDWDYAYVEVSEDGGRTWRTLPGRYTTDTNPIGHNYGYGYTGKSEGWKEEEIDLTPYAGKKILLRFEYVTDDAVNNPGLALDNICIVETSLCDGAEAPGSEWEAHGFVPVGGLLPQTFIVQVIAFGEQVKVNQLPLDAANRGALPLSELGSSLQRVVLVVAATTPVTTEQAQYEYAVR